MKSLPNNQIEVKEYQSLNKLLRTGLHLEFQVDTYYGLNPTPQSPIGSVCVDVKGEISHATLNMLIRLGDCYSPT